MNANASAANSAALGPNASAIHANSVAIGAGTSTTAPNQVNVGSRTISGVSAGAVTATSTEAINGSQLFATNTTVATHATQIATLNANVGTLQTQVAGITTNIAGLQADVGTLFDLQRRDRREARRGTAAAVAMSEAPMPSHDGAISYSLHGAAYRGEYAVGGSLKYRISQSAALDFGVSHAGHNDSAVRAGISGEF